MPAFVGLGRRLLKGHSLLMNLNLIELKVFNNSVSSVKLGRHKLWQLFILSVF